MSRAVALVAFATLALSACQTAPPQVVETGALPVSGPPTSVAFVRTTGEEALAATALEEAVRQRLKTWNLVETPPETASYLVEITRSQTPLGIGVGTTGASGQALAWLTPPAVKASWPARARPVQALSITLIDPATGRAVFRRAAIVPINAAEGSVVLSHLLDLVIVRGNSVGARPPAKP